MKGLTKAAISLVILFSFIFIPGIILAPSGYVVDGNKVYINDANVYISAEPHTVHSSGYVYFNVTSKVYTGNVDIVFGFDTDSAQPLSAELYKPHEVRWNSTTSLILYNVTDLQTTADSCDIGTGNIKRRATYMTSDGISHTKVICFDSYEQDGDTYTVHYNIEHSKTVDWVDYSHTFSSVDYDFGGMNKWYYVKNVPITAGTNYLFRGYVKIPIRLGSVNGKYWFAIKPSSETISEAIASGHLYYLDPWWDTNYNYKQLINITNNNATTAMPAGFAVCFDADLQTLINASKLQEDCDDLRIVDETADIERARVNETMCNTTATQVCFNITSGIAAGSYNDTSYYMYYGYASASDPGYTRNQVYIVYDEFADGDFTSDPTWTIYVGDTGEAIIMDTNSSYGNSLGIARQVGGDFTGVNVTVGDVDNIQVSFATRMNISRATTQQVIPEFKNNGGYHSGSEEYLLQTSMSSGADEFDFYRGYFATNIIDSTNDDTVNWQTINITHCGGVWKTYNDEALKGSVVDTTSTGWTTIGIEAHGTEGAFHLIDNFKVMHFITPDYTIALGSEESRAIADVAITITIPENTTYTSAQTLNFTIDNTTEVDSCWYNINGNADINITGCVNLTSMPDEQEGFNNVTVYINDTAGGSNSSAINYTIDSLAFSIAFETPTPSNETVTVNHAYINITTGETPSSIQLEWNGTNETMSGSGTAWYVNKTSLLNGNYTFRVYANDSMGNSNSSGTRYVYINKKIVAIEYETPTPADSTVAESHAYINVTVDDTPEWIYLEWNGSNMSMSNNGLNYYVNRSCLGEGNYTYKIWANNTAGVNSTSSRRVEINVPWYNVSWNTRQPIIFEETNGTERVYEPFEINLTGLTDKQGDSDDILIISPRDGGIEVPYDLLSNTSTSAYVVFLVNATANTNTTWYVYYNNSGATKPSYTTDLEITTMVSYSNAYHTSTHNKIENSYYSINVTDWNITNTFAGCTADSTLFDCFFLVQHGSWFAKDYSNTTAIGRVAVDIGTNAAWNGWTALGPNCTTSILFNGSVMKYVYHYCRNDTASFEWYAYIKTYAYNRRFFIEMNISDGTRYQEFWPNSILGDKTAPNQYSLYRSDINGTIMNGSYPTATGEPAGANKETIYTTGWISTQEIVDSTGISIGMIYDNETWVTNIAGGNNFVQWYHGNDDYGPMEHRGAEPEIPNRYGTDHPYCPGQNLSMWFGAYLLGATVYENVEADSDIVNNPLMYVMGGFETGNGSDTTYPIVALTSPINITYGSGNITLTYTATDDTAIDTCMYEFNSTNTTVAGCANTTFLADEGYNYVKIWANDTSGNMNYSSTVEFSVDTTAPTITINAPANITYGLTNVTLNFDRYDINNISVCYYELNSGSNTTIINCANTTFTGITGLNTIKIWANDSFGNWGVSPLTSFNIDTLPASLSMSAPTNTTYGTANRTLTFTSWDQGFNNISSCLYELNGNANVTITSCANTTFLGDEGNNSIKMWSNDTFNNWNSTSLVIFTIDTTKPAVAMSAPTNTTYTDTNATINFTATDDRGIDTCMYELNGVNITIVGCTNTTFPIRTTPNTIKIYANNTLGVWGNSSLVIFSLYVQTPPGGAPGGGSSSQYYALDAEVTDETVCLGSNLHYEITITSVNMPGQGVVIEVYLADSNGMKVTESNRDNIYIETDEERTLAGQLQTIGNWEPGYYKLHINMSGFNTEKSKTLSVYINDCVDEFFLENWREYFVDYLMLAPIEIPVPLANPIEIPFVVVMLMTFSVTGLIVFVAGKTLMSVLGWAGLVTGVIGFIIYVLVIGV